MTETVVVATIAAAPPTAAAILAYASARTTRRELSRSSLVELTGHIAAVVERLERIEGIVDRTDTAIGDLRERVARIEGTLAQSVPR